MKNSLPKTALIICATILAIHTQDMRFAILYLLAVFNWE